jgi:hypothetical protein
MNTSKMNSSTSKMNASTILRKINEHRLSLIKHLAPNASDYGFGGSHRCWIIESACDTADAYIADVEQMSKALSETVDTPIVIVVPYKMAIPMPPAWGGVRPSETTEVYGHPHTKGKDWRHFENTLRWRFADKGYMCACASMNDDEGIIFVASKMVACITGMPTIDEKMTKKNNYTHTASTPDYDKFCVECDKHFEGSKIAEQKAITDAYPPMMRPMIAMSMCGGDE